MKILRHHLTPQNVLDLSWKEKWLQGSRIQQLTKYRKVPLQERHPGISYEQMVKQREKMNVVIGNLWQIKSEVEMKLGESKLTRDLDRYIEKLQLCRGLKLDDAVYDFEQQVKRKSSR